MSKGGNRPGGVKCSSCHVIEEYRNMVRIRQKWYCQECQRRLQKYGLWPPS